MKFKLNMREENILHAEFTGDIDKEDWLAYFNEYQAFLGTATEERPLHCLADVSQMGKISASARKLFIDSFRNPDPRVGKTALVGVSPYVRVLTGLVLKATGRQDIRLFATEEEALAWLRGETDEE